MLEKVKHLFTQKTQRQNKLPLSLLSLLLQILLTSCSFSLIVSFTTFSNSFFHARMLHKKSLPFTSGFSELSRSFKIVTGDFLMLYCAGNLFYSCKETRNFFGADFLFVCGALSVSS